MGTEGPVMVKVVYLTESLFLRLEGSFTWFHCLETKGTSYRFMDVI